MNEKVKSEVKYRGLIWFLIVVFSVAVVGYMFVSLVYPYVK